MKTTPPPSPDWRQEREAFLALIDPDSHFHRVFDALPDVHFFVKDALGRTLFCSSRLPLHHGLRNEQEMLGKTNRDLTPGPLAEKYLADDAEIYRTGEPSPPIIEVCLDPVGLPDWYATAKHPIKDRNGRVVGIMGTLRRRSDLPFHDSDGGRLAPATARLAAEPTSFPPVAELARSCHLSPRQFQRLFRSAFGMSPRTYWMKLRIRAACESLQQGRETIAQLARRLGFWDASDFTRHFRKHTGRTPSAFARDHRSAGRPD